MRPPDGDASGALGFQRLAQQPPLALILPHPGCVLFQWRAIWKRKVSQPFDACSFATGSRRKHEYHHLIIPANPRQAGPVRRQI